MAQAIVTSIREQVAGADGTSVDVTFNVTYTGSELGRVDFSTFTINMLPGDTPIQFRDKIASAVKAQATGYGYSIPNNGILMPSYARA